MCIQYGPCKIARSREYVPIKDDKWIYISLTDKSFSYFYFESEWPATFN
jgi:hypothetical protein